MLYIYRLLSFEWTQIKDNNTVPWLSNWSLILVRAPRLMDSTMKEASSPGFHGDFPLSLLSPVSPNSPWILMLTWPSLAAESEVKDVWTRTTYWQTENDQRHQFYVHNSLWNKNNFYKHILLFFSFMHLTHNMIFYNLVTLRPELLWLPGSGISPGRLMENSLHVCPSSSLVENQWLISSLCCSSVSTSTSSSCKNNNKVS